MYPQSEQEYQADLNAQGEHEAATEAAYHEYITTNAIKFLTYFYGTEPNGSPEAENLITLISSAFEWMDKKGGKS